MAGARRAGVVQGLPRPRRVRQGHDRAVAPCVSCGCAPPVTPALCTLQVSRTVTLPTPTDDGSALGSEVAKIFAELRVPAAEVPRSRRDTSPGGMSPRRAGAASAGSWDGRGGAPARNARRRRRRRRREAARDGCTRAATWRLRRTEARCVVGRARARRARRRRLVRRFRPARRGKFAEEFAE